MDFIDLIIIALFLIATFSIGVYYGGGIKTFQTYAVGSRKMSAPVITLSLLATTYGGGILSSAPNDYYRLGLYAFMMDLASPINFYFASRFVLSRMKEFIYNLSIAESMGVIYGPVVRVVTALFGIVMTVSLLTVQVKFGQIVITELLSSHTTDLPSHYTAIALLILSLLFIGYATFGGARSVAVTDVYQFLLFGLCFPVLIFLFLNHTKDFIAGWQKLIALPVYNPIKVFQWNDMLKGILIYIFYRTIFPFDPARIHRFYMSSSPQQAIKVFNRSALIRVLLAFLFLSLAISLHISGHVIDRNCNVMRYIIKLAYFPGMHGILVSVIMALLMSTADSNLHVASVLFANDIYPVLIGGNPSLKIIRTASVTIGIVSVIVAWHTTDALIPFLYKAVSVYGPVVTVPFIMTCLGFRPRSIVVLLNMLVHAMVASYRIYVGYVGSEKLVFESIILSVFSLLVAHYILPKKACTGWIGIKDSSIWDLQNQVTKRWLLKQSRKWIGYFNTAYWEAIFPRKQSTFVWLGGYMIISTLIMLCCIKQHYFWPYIYSYMTVMVIGSIIVLYPALHCYQEGGVRLLRKLWPVLLFLLLFVFSIQFLKLSHYRPIVCALWVVNLCLAIVLLSLEIGIMMSFVAIMLHNIVPPSISFRELSLAGFTVLSMEHVLAMLLTTAVVVGFGTYKYLRDQSASKFKVMNLARNYEHAIGIEAIYNKANCHRIDSYYGNQLFQEMIAKLEASHDYLVKHGQQELIQDIAMLRQSMHGFHELFLQKSKTENSIELDSNCITTVSFKSTILKVLDHIQAIGEPVQLLLRNQVKTTQLSADPALFECLIMLNLWEISKSAQAIDHMVSLSLSDTTLQYGYAMDKLSNQVPLVLPALCFCFSTDTIVYTALPVYIVSGMVNAPLPTAAKTFYQIESRQITEAHGGYVEIIENESSLTCLYVLPIQGDKVMRFKNYKPADLVVNKLAETAESLAQEKELITLLPKVTALSEEVVIKTISFIKNAHGLVVRQTGDPYYTHPMTVTTILLEVTQDPITLLAGLLHDVVEDTPITLNQIALMYGMEVATIVDAVTHYNTSGFKWKLSKNENIKLLNKCKDSRVIRIKLADRLHNLRTLGARKSKDQQRIAEETLTFYIPWGKRNKGPLHWLEEMERICEKTLQLRHA